MIWLAIGFALASAGTTALSTAVQHHAAGAGPLTGLWRRPRWLLALALGPVGFTWHVLALRYGPISLVQPIVVVGIVVALPLRELMVGSRPEWRDVRTATTTVAALALFLLVADPGSAPAAPDPTQLFLAVGTCALAAGAVAVLARAARRPATRAAALGVTSGVLFGLMAVLVDATQLWLRTHPAAALPLTWLPYAVVACGVGGLAVNQVAYSAGPLSTSMPVLNVTNCLLTVAFGVTVLRETVDTSPTTIAIAVLCLVVIAHGLWSLRPIVVVVQSFPCDARAPTRSRSGWA
ncbi:DMT family transporter [Nocardioides maradonensis]